MVYLSTYLPKDHPLREDTTNFPVKDERETPPPQLVSAAEVKEYHQLYDNSPQPQKPFVAKSLGCKVSYSLMRLPGHDPTTQVFPDPMHTVTNVVTTLVSTLVGPPNVEKRQWDRPAGVESSYILYWTLNAANSCAPCQTYNICTAQHFDQIIQSTYTYTYIRYTYAQ